MYCIELLGTATPDLAQFMSVGNMEAPWAAYADATVAIESAHRPFGVSLPSGMPLLLAMLPSREPLQYGISEVGYDPVGIAAVVTTPSIAVLIRQKGPR
jgi:hypothetical protein